MSLKAVSLPSRMKYLQFVVCFAHAVYVAWGSKTVPVWLCCAQLWVMVNMLVLFGNFYRQSYLKKSQIKQADLAKAPLPAAPVATGKKVD